MKTTLTPITSSSDQSDPASPPRTLADKEIRLSGLTPRQVQIRRLPGDPRKVLLFDQA